MQPTQFTTADGTLAGLVNGTNPAYNFVPNPRVLFYPVPGVSGTLLFRNGLLVDEYGDYGAGPGYFAMIFDVGTDIVTALLFAAGSAPTKMRLQDATVRAIGTLNIRLSARADPAHTEPQPFILFRNGLRLTEGADYTTTGPWVNLVIQQEIQIGDAITMVIDAGGIAVTTVDGSIVVVGNTVINPLPGGGFNTGTFNSTGFNSGGFNGGFLPNTFLLPFSPTQALVWFNGLLLTPDVDYVLVDNELVTLELFDVGDILTVQLYGGEFEVDPGGGGGDIQFGGGFNSGGFNTNPFNGGFGPVPPPPAPIIIFVPGDGPIIVSSATGSLYFSTAASTWFYRNGLTMTPPYDGVVDGNRIILGPPETGAIVTAEAWTPHPLDQDEPDLNLGQLYDSLNGGILGVKNGVNNIFTLNVPFGTTGIPVPVLVTQIVLSRNGVFLTEGFDYMLTGNVISFMGGVYPAAGDILTAQVFLQ